jgi:hypothetical protein
MISDKLLLAFASTVIVGSGSRGTHDHDINVSNIYKFSSHLTGKTFCLHKKNNQIMLFREIIDVYCETHMKHTVHFVGKYMFFNVKAHGAYTYHSALKG